MHIALNCTDLYLMLNLKVKKVHKRMHAGNISKGKRKREELGQGGDTGNY